MAYSKQNFQDGQILTAANLEKMENGIIAGQGVRNLLDNSNFADLVALDGLNKSYGDTTYLADRWIGHYNITPTARTDGIFLTTTDNYAYIQQRVKLKQGKTYTLALSTTGGTTMQRIAVFNIGLTEIFAAVEGSNSVIITTFNAAYDDMAMLFYPGFADGGGSAIFKWAALYEGAYTADTLPLYVPKGKHVEMLNCGAPLAPHNLLDNSDFRIKNNIINTKGLTDYSFDSGNVFDRWRLHWTGDGRVSIKDGYIELYRKTYSTYLFQHPKDLESMIGKTYTVAAKVRYNGYIGWIDSTQRVNSGSLALNDWDIATCTFTVGSATSDIGKAGIEIATKADLSFEIQWVALYEGAYTKETLPAYLTKGKHVEMLNCNVPLAPHNLLDNSDFRNPVNQRGIESGTTVSAWKYHIDRWNNYHDADGTISFNTNGIVINMHMGQVLNPDSVKTGTVVTAAVKWNDGTIQIARGTITRGNAWTWFYSGTQNGSLVGVIDNGDNRTSIFVVQSDGRKTLVWAALYEGAYDASTLPPYQPKGYAAELAECMRYFERIGSAESIILGNTVYVGSGAKAFVFSIKYAPKRLKSPSVTFSDVSNYRVLFQDAVNASVYGASGITAIDDIMAENPYARFRVSISSAIDTNSWAALQRQDGAQNAYIDISADL